MANNPKADKGTFILRSDFYPQVQLLTREQRGDLLTAIFAYTSDEKIPELDGVTKMCFEFIKASIDFYAVKYDAQCKKNRENGRKGGRPKKSGGNDENQSDNDGTGRFEENPPESEKTERFLEQPTESDETGRIHEQPDETEITDGIMEQPDETEITERPKNNRYSYCDCDTDCDCGTDNSTHTVITEKKGGAGENNAAPVENPANVEAAKLLAWIAASVPTVAAMAEPLTEQNIVWMLRKYSVEDIQRIIQAMHNKRAYENVNAYTTFGNFARRDTQLNDHKNTGRTASSKPRRYTYPEYLTAIDQQNGGKYRGSDFHTIREAGKLYWVLASEIPTSEA
uniref:DUF6291 domain-containing protein n=1 Tax=Alistipes sp. D31t1_170403_E11 TaxID=2787128 RepID=UPI00189C0DE3|nr:DUF6291 domain-containing protein [Alistipes sp. D31t1_170403_E11]